MIKYSDFIKNKRINVCKEMSEAIDWHTINQVPLNESVFRVGSDKYFEFFRSARTLVKEGQLTIDDPVDSFIINETELGEIVEHEGEHVPLDCPMYEEEESQPELNKPKRGGKKKFYVYVRDPSTGNIKKVSWGDTTGLTVKLNNPAARRSFAARHQCSSQTDRTKPAYWACRTPYYAKQLGLSGGGKFFW